MQWLEIARGLSVVVPMLEIVPGVICRTQKPRSDPQTLKNLDFRADSLVLDKSVAGGTSTTVV